MRKEQRKRDRKRKKKQEEKKRQAREAQTLAYTGNKYRTKELVQTWMHTEIGIYETYVMTDYTLVDKTVASALESLIRELRSGSLPPLSATDEIVYEPGQEKDLLITNIRRHWANHFATEWQPPRDKLVGVLRSMLGSLETMASRGPKSQSYIKHVVGFLTKEFGVSVEVFSADEEPWPAPEENYIMELGRQWYANGDQEARAEFFQLATDLMQSGEAARVINACQLLAEEISDQSPEVSQELMALSLNAFQSQITARV